MLYSELWTEGCTGIGQEVLITTSSTRRLASKVYTTVISTLVQDDTAEIQHCDWLVGLQISERQASWRIQDILLGC